VRPKVRRHRINELERIPTSPGNAARFMREFGIIDVTPLLAQVHCPTLVLHSKRRQGAVRRGRPHRVHHRRRPLRADRQIAAVLGLSEKTVRNHITRIFERLEVVTRAQAIVRARDAGFGRLAR
jgi:hypothetical protein